MLENNTILILLACILVVLILILGDFKFEFKFTKEKESNNNKDSNPLDLLSNSEYKVLELVIDGLTNQEIADQLHVSTATVKKHISNIYKKLDISKRAETRKYRSHFDTK